MDELTKAEATVKTARTTLGNAIVKWDGAYDVFVNTGEKYAVTPNDVTSMGGEPLGKTINALVMPISVDATWNPKTNIVRMHVHRAPGMDVVTVQVSPEPLTATSWYELDGNEAIHVIPNPPKGTLWIRAQSRTTRAKSDFTTPVVVTVK